MAGKKTSKRLMLGIALLILAAILYYISIAPVEISNPSIEEKILTKLNLSSNETQITKLTNLVELKEKYPVVYDEAKEGDYEIRTPNKLMIYDYDNNKIIKEFDLSRITVG